MKNILFTFIGTLLALQIQAQIKGTVVNAVDKKPIPYVNIWFENENIGTTADEEGKFALPTPKDNQSLIFNALGYQNKTILASEIDAIIYLVPKVFTLNEVVVSSAKKSIEFKIGAFKSNTINTYYGSNINYPYLVARYFPHLSQFSNTPFIKSIMPYCKSDVKDAKFRLRIFEANKDGLPGNELIKEDIIITVKKGNSKPIIDLTNYNLAFPEHGLFVGLEFMYLVSNKYDFTYTIYKTKEKRKVTTFEPSFGTVTGESEEKETWRFSKGKWYKTNWFNNEGQAGKDKDLLAIEITLTN